MGATGRLYTPESQRIIRFLPVLLQTLTLLPGIAWAVDSVPKSCPLRTKHYKAQLVQTHLTGTVGETVILHFSLDPPSIPQGFFLSVKMNALQEPEAARGKTPEILTGFPEASLLFRAPGVYRYKVVVSLIAKSSCGGVKADTILIREARIDVKE